MLKKMILLLLTAGMLISCLLTAQAGGVSRAEMYEALQEELHRYLDGDDAMPLEDLTTQFEELGAYKKSVAFRYYTAVLRDAQAEDYTNVLWYTNLMRLDSDFCAMLSEEGFPSVDEVEAYALGRQKETEGDWASAVGYYEKSITVLDSMLRLAQLSRLVSVPEPTPTPCPHVGTSWQRGEVSYTPYSSEEHTMAWTDSLVCAGCGTVVNSEAAADREAHSFVGLECWKCGFRATPTPTPAPTPDPSLYQKADFRVGSVVEFGHYEQDGRSGNGQEPIEWLVLDKSGNSVMLLACEALDSKAYHDGYESVQVTWSECTLRTWLNNSFYRTAFSDREQNAIRTTNVSTPWMPQYDTYPGPDTWDKVYLLSYQECQRYLNVWTVYPTQYAINRGVMVRSDVGGTTYWWLRSTHTYGKVSVINSIGNLYGSRTNDVDGGVRPVIWVDLSNPIFR